MSRFLVFAGGRDLPALLDFFDDLDFSWLRTSGIDENQTVASAKARQIATTAASLSGFLICVLHFCRIVSSQDFRHRHRTPRVQSNWFPCQVPLRLCDDRPYELPLVTPTF